MHLHRMDCISCVVFCGLQVARAGRFGTKGLAITFQVSDSAAVGVAAGGANTPAAADEARILKEVQDRFEVRIIDLPDEIEVSSYLEVR